MSNISKEILEKIQEEKIKPISRWKFSFHQYLVWTFFAISVLFGSFAVAVMIFVLKDRDWDIYKYLNKSFGEYVILSIPYFWLILVMAFLVFALYEFKKTNRGYRYGILKIGTVNIVASLVLGTLFFFAGFGSQIEGVFANKMPFYQNMHFLSPQKIWDNPQNGLLVGQIIEFTEGGDFNLRDPGGNTWKINCVDCTWRRDGEFKTAGVTVKLIGIEKEQGVFEVGEIRPWKAPIPCANPEDINSCMMIKVPAGGASQEKIERRFQMMRSK